MKVYEAIFDETDTEGVYGISLVEDPAMQDEWITLSRHPKQVEFSAVDDKKNILLGAVLIPNKRIYRNMGGNEFEMKFSESTIEKLAHNFQRNSYQNNSSLEHEIALSDVTFVETWTVKDPHNDKSNAFGKVYPKGTWVTMAKVSEDNYKKAQQGEIKGFSIDAILKLNEVNFKNETQMSVEKQSIVDAVKEGIKAFFLSEKEEPTQEAAATEEEAVEEPTQAEEQGAEPNQEEMVEAMKEVFAQFSTEVDKKIEAVRVEFTKEKEALVKENEALKTELSKEPEAEPIRQRGEVKVELSTDGEILELLRSANKN